MFQILIENEYHILLLNWTLHFMFLEATIITDTVDAELGMINC